MSPTKIGIILVTNSFETGGIERNMRMVARYLPDQFEREIWALKSPPHESETGCAVEILHRRGRFDPWLVGRLRRKLARHPAQLIHFFHFASGLHVLLANLLLGRRRKRMVFSFGSARKNSRLISWYFRISCRFADRITGNSPSVVKGLLEHGAPPDRIEVLPNGHDPTLFERDESKEQLRKRIGLPIGRIIAITTGRLTESKRHCDLLDGLALLARDSKIDLVIVGDGELRQELEIQTTRLNLNDRVRFAGFQSNVPDYLLASDLFVFPSETEGLPNSLIEASLASLPIVACRVEGVIDVIRDGENGILVEKRHPAELARAIQGLLDDWKTATQLGARARQAALENFGLTGMIARVVKIYERVLKPKPPSPSNADQNRTVL